MVGVDDRDHDQRAQVVKHGDGQQENAQAGRGARREQREGAQRQGRIRGHRRGPAAGTWAAGVEREVDRDGHRHATDRGHRGDRQPTPLTELAQVELPLGLESDDQKEEGHQAFVDPVAQVG